MQKNIPAIPLLALILLILVAAALPGHGQTFRIRRDVTATQEPGVQNVKLDNSSMFSQFQQEPVQVPGNSSSSETGNSTEAGFETQRAVVRLKPRETHPYSGGITAKDLSVLANHDVAVVIDRSFSMFTRDCPAPFGMQPPSPVSHPFSSLTGALLGGSGGAVSRWEWCQMQADNLARMTASVLPRGLTVVLFSSRPRLYNNVTAAQLGEIFAANHPGGGTDTTAALRCVLDDYFMRREAAGQVKPLAIAVITDGMPNNPHSLKECIIKATTHLRRQDELAITFLQVGTEREGIALVSDLDNLVGQGAKYDIVDTKTFPNLLRTGLARALVDAVMQSRRMSYSAY